MKVICITGGIGSGKSVVAKIFETLGYPVFYSDAVAKQAYFVPSVKQKIIELLGKEAYKNDFEIDKDYISSKIFSDKDLLAKINSIIHSQVKLKFQDFVNQNTEQPFVFKESALIFEAQLQSNCDKIILVTAPQSLKIQRVKERDNLTEQEIFKRMQHQWDDEKKIPLADYVINNDDKTPVLPQVLRILEYLKTTL